MKNTRQTKQDKQDHLEDMREWQAHQFDPGYYTGGRVPPILKKPAKPVILGVLFMLGGLATLTSIIIQTVQFSSNFENLGQYLITSIPILLIALVLLGAGFSILKRGLGRSR